MSRASHLKRLYGITEEQYQEMLDNQDGRCFICQRHHTEFKTRLAVDHSHKTGEIRGLLCSHCNHRLVGRHTDPDLLRTIASYLEQGTGLYVPVDRPKRRRKRTRK